MGSLSLDHKLTIINFSKENLTPGTESYIKTRKEVTSALEQYGCFIAVCDDISSEIHNGVFSALEELFDLPLETKMQNESSKPLYGYVGQIPFIPLFESMGVDDAITKQGIQAFANVMWPNGNQDFCEKLYSYTKLAAELEQIATRMVFESYGVGKYYESHLKSCGYLCKVMKYREAKPNENKLGFLSHTDKDFMSTIYQNQVNGLEIKAKDGEWFSVDFPPSSVVVVAGDAIMGWSNNRIKSPYHRVTMDGKGTRYSLAQFSFVDGIVETPEELVDDEHPLQFKPFHNIEYLKFYSKEENRRLECALKTYCGV